MIPTTHVILKGCTHYHTRWFPIANSSMRVLVCLLCGQQLWEE